MQRRGPQRQQGLAMHSRSIASMTFKAVTLKPDRQPQNQRITRLFRQYTGSSNRGRAGVTSNQRLL